MKPLIQLQSMELTLLLTIRASTPDTPNKGKGVQITTREHK